jgi:hypothetical protein
VTIGRPLHHVRANAFRCGSTAPASSESHCTVNGQTFSGTDLAKLLTNNWLTDTFIERGIRAVLPIDDVNLDEGIALTVSAVWDWKQSKTKIAIGQRSKPGAMALIIRGSGYHFTLDVRCHGKATGNYLVDSLPTSSLSARPASSSVQPASTSTGIAAISPQPSSTSALKVSSPRLRRPRH